MKHFELFDFAPVFSLDGNALALPANENQPGVRLMRDILHCLLELGAKAMQLITFDDTATVKINQLTFTYVLSVFMSVFLLFPFTSVYKFKRIGLSGYP